jgi:uncharacterized membrane protein
MGSAIAGGLGGFGLVAFLFLVVLVIAWIVMPFAIIGTKPLLRDLLSEQRRTNELLRQLGAAPKTLPSSRASSSSEA